MALADADAFLALVHRVAPARTTAVWRHGAIHGVGGTTYEWLARCVQHCHRILDVGGGDGKLSKFARMSPSHHAVAQTWVTLDSSPDELARCNHTWSTPVLGRAQAMPFADASVDAVVSHLGVTVMSESARVVAEIARVLAPGGTLAIITGGGPKVGSLLESALELALPFAGDLPRLGSAALRDPRQLRAIFAPPAWCDVQLSDFVVDFPRDLVLPWLLSQYEFALLDAAAVARLATIINAHVAAAPSGQRAIAAVIGLVATRQP